MHINGVTHQILGTALTGKAGYTTVEFDPDPSGTDPTLGIQVDYLTGDVDGDGKADIISFTLEDPTTSPPTR